MQQLVLAVGVTAGVASFEPDSFGGRRVYLGATRKLKESVLRIMKRSPFVASRSLAKKHYSFRWLEAAMIATIGSARSTRLLRFKESLIAYTSSLLARFPIG